MLKNTLIDALYEIWPMLLIFLVIISSVRLAFLLCNKQKIVLWKEFFALAFIVYIMVLFYVVTFQDTGGGTFNFIPFREMFRYDFGSDLFIKNIVGNTLLFVPLGLLSAFYINKRRLFPIFSIALISSLAIEITQSKIGRVFDIDDIMLNIIGSIIGYFFYIAVEAIGKSVPRIFKTDGMKNLIILILIIAAIIYLLSSRIGIFKHII